ncbi:prolyl oligopeptidase family serine peptidase [Ramlibacter sp.]|uniref:prolyl oligopeptidase family serine peptidase n=1 Tax=Ramlibacter sp. TaxID=1917967 RepID=UPI002CBCC98A|nr:prolyl oligopeptidase family serine peptidase [Ramlibacter sp.]HWI81495.1 prolyl oligopeptidase family serine peptidase [Ramlibacter sp.]
MRDPISRRRATLALLAGAMAGRALANHVPAPRGEVTETLHGVAVRDPFRALENTSDPAVQAWLRAEGAHARDALDRIAGRDRLEQRIAEIAGAAGDSVSRLVRMPGDRLFYLKRLRGQQQYQLMLRVGLHGREQVLVDPQQEAARTGVPHAINYFRPSWDGEYVAYGLSAGGGENASLHLLRVRTRELVGAPIERVHEGNVGWLPDSRSLTYNQLKPLTAEDPETETYLDSRVMWLRVGDREQQARPVFGPTVNPELGLARLEVGALLFVPGSPWVVARTSDTTYPEGSLFLARVADLDRPRVPWRRIASFDDHIVEIDLQGQHLFYRTRRDAPRFRIMRLDLRQPALARAVEVARPPADGVFEGFLLTADGLVAEVRQGTAIGLRRYRPGELRGQPLALAFPGAARAHDDPAHAYPDVLYTLSGWIEPPKVLRWHAGRSSEVVLGVPPRLPPLPAIEVLEVKVPSHDGALVPMTILQRTGLPRDGRNPTLLTAYGAYGHSLTASFSPSNMAWLELGGVLALPNVRGSGVYGEPWRLAGTKASKPNTWKDGIACAEYLIAQRIASPATLAVMGTSAGGIFVGRCVTSAPQLFAAAIFNVGVMDAVRAEDSANGITNISEFGSARNPIEFPALLEMSTYHQITDGTRYPAVLLVHGLNDPRVDVWHSAKAAARLQAATASGKPVLLRLDGQAGHGVGSTARQRYALAADIYSFLLWQMGKAKAAA